MNCAELNISDSWHHNGVQYTQWLYKINKLKASKKKYLFKAWRVGSPVVPRKMINVMFQWWICCNVRFYFELFIVTLPPLILQSLIQIQWSPGRVFTLINRFALISATDLRQIESVALLNCTDGLICTVASQLQVRGGSPRSGIKSQSRVLHTGSVSLHLSKHLRHLTVNDVF